MEMVRQRSVMLLLLYMVVCALICLPVGQCFCPVLPAAPGRGHSFPLKAFVSNAPGAVAPNGVTTTSSGVEVRIRSVAPSDMWTIASLCIATFRPPFDWWQAPAKWQAEFLFQQNLNTRFEMLGRKKIQHAMIIAEDPQTSELLGFMEIGMLPPPPSRELWKVDDLVKEESDRKPKYQMSFNAFLGYVERDPTMEVPYLANLVVVEAARGKGIGRSLVQEGERLAAEEFKAAVVYVAVEPDNPVAQKLYEKMGFDFVVQEEMKHAKMRKRTMRRKYYGKKLS